MERQYELQSRTYEQPPIRTEFIDATPPPQALKRSILREEPFSTRSRDIPNGLINENSEGMMISRVPDNNL